MVGARLANNGPGRESAPLPTIIELASTLTVIKSFVQIFSILSILNIKCIIRKSGWIFLGNKYGTCYANRPAEWPNGHQLAPCVCIEYIATTNPFESVESRARLW